MRTPIPKVAVVSLPRTGSTLICEALAQHPQILGFGEIFLHNEDGREWYHKSGTGGDRHFYPGPAKFEDYMDYLDALARLKDRSVITFKLMDYQEPKAWELLEADEARVIHTRRMNVLECLASSLAAEQTKIWHARASVDVSVASATKIEVPEDELVRWHERRVAFDERIETWPGKKLTLEYHLLNLTEDLGELAQRLFNFIGLPPFPDVKLTQMKLNTRPLRERVANYDNLKSLFAGSDLAAYFSE